MSSERNFRELYKTYSIGQLVRILEEQEDYLPEAVEAAQAELDFRNPDEEMLEGYRMELEKLRPREVDLKPVVYRLWKALLRFANRELNPFKKYNLRALINLIAVWVMVNALMAIYQQWSFYTLIITEYSRHGITRVTLWDFMYLGIPLFSMLAAFGYFFWKKWGWFMVAFIVNTTVFFPVILAVDSYNSGLRGMSPGPYITGVLILAHAGLYLRKVRRVYKVFRQEIYITVAFSFGLSLYTWIFLMR